MTDRHIVSDLLDMPGHLLRRMNQRSTQHFQAAMREADGDMTPVQFAALDALKHQTDIDQARLADLVACDRATMGGVVDRLERRGLIQRSVNAQDRRARVLALTPEGLALHSRLLPLVTALQRTILDGLDADERRTLVRLMRKSLTLGDAEDAR